MNNNLLIHESAQFGDVSVTSKSADVLEFIATLQEAGAPNRNGRIYPKSVLEKALDSPNIRERLATKTWFGECNHPSETSVVRQMQVDLRNVAFIIKEIWWEGNLLKGRCECANTAVGKDMRALIEQGCKVAFSLRAQGNVHTNPTTGLVEVEEGLQILTYDFVAVPSHAKAFLERICEATIMSMYGSSKKNLSSQILCESEDLFMNGQLLNIEPTAETVHMDYTKNYTDKFKKVDEMYRPENGDEIEFMGIKETVVVNKAKNISKKVLTEDFIVKDIRGKISELFEAPTVEVLDDKEDLKGFKYSKTTTLPVLSTKPDKNGNYSFKTTDKHGHDVRGFGNTNPVIDAKMGLNAMRDKDEGIKYLNKNIRPEGEYTNPGIPKSRGGK